MKPEDFLKVVLLVDLLDVYLTDMQMNQRAKMLLNRCKHSVKEFVKFMDTGIPLKDAELIGELSDAISDILDKSILYDNEKEVFNINLKPTIVNNSIQ